MNEEYLRLSIFRQILFITCLIGLGVGFAAAPGWAQVGFSHQTGAWNGPNAQFYRQFHKPRGISLEHAAIFDLRRNPMVWTYSANLAEGIVTYEATAFDLPYLSGQMTVETYIETIRAATLRNIWREEIGRTQNVGVVFGRSDNGPLTWSLPVDMPPLVEKIFGEGEPRLTLSGQQRISFEGRSQWNPKAASTERFNQSKFPQLKMDQQLSVRLDGSIGDKMHVFVDHSSGQTRIDVASNIRLRYEGKEDDIIKEIEAGNTNLSLSGGGLVSGSIPHQGLFGIKVRAQIADVKLTMIASKEEGKFSTASYTGFGSRDSTGVWDYQYEKRMFFWLYDPEFLWTVRNNNYVLDQNYLPAGNSRIYVYYDDNRVSPDDIGSKPGYIKAAQVKNAAQDSVFNENFILMEEGTQYVIDLELGLIRFISPIQDSWTVGIAYTNGAGTTVGSVAGDTLRLHMLRPPSMTPASGCWLYELRNLYRMGSTFNPANDRYTLNIFRQNLEGGQIDKDYNTDPNNRYIRLLGLDRNSDGIVDSEHLTRIQGFLWIPYFRPLQQIGDGKSYYPFELPSTILDVSNPAIYNKPESQIDINTDRKYYISLIVERPQSQIRLNQLGIIEGSVRVRVNGQVWREGTDYTVNYDFGTVNLITQTAGSDQIAIDYEFAGLAGFAAQQKTLMGIRADYDYGDNFSFGTTWMYEGEKAIDERPKVGEEASRTLVGGFDASFKAQPQFLTKLVDALPIISTEAPSSFSITAEAAVSLPNPNIKGDGYIDDMEGVIQSSSFGISRRSWRFGSVPDIQENEVNSLLDIHDFGTLKWFNPGRGHAPRLTEIFGKLLENQQDDEQTVLEMRFTPYDSISGIMFANQPDSLKRSWAGVQQLIRPANGDDYHEMDYLEVWVYSEFEKNTIQLKPGFLKIDLGDISEDAVRRIGSKSEKILPPNGDLDTEDGLRNEAIEYDGKLQEWEDVGLDRLAGDDGKAVRDTANCNNVTAVCDTLYDDDNDDYPRDTVSNTSDFSTININGTEDNNELDSEDLDNNGSLRLRNSTAYIQFAIDLSDTATGSFFVPGTYNIEEDNKGAWRKYQIPLRDVSVDTISNGGTFSLTTVRNVRMWLTGFETLEQHTVKIYSLEVTGNRWLPRGFKAFGDTTCQSQTTAKQKFNIGTKNNKEYDYYKKPPNVATRRDVSGVAEREQTLSLEYFNFRPGYEAKSSQPFTSPVNFLSYKEVRFWVAYPQDYINTSDPTNIGEAMPLDLFVRFGADDSLNYYEYAIDLSQEVNSPGINWHEIVIPLPELTNIKLDRDRAMADSTWLRADIIYPDSSTYTADTRVRVRGQPTLHRVASIALGVRNRSCPKIATGEVWVNELRLSGVNRDMGWSTLISANIRFADLGGVSVSLTRENSDYTSFNGRRTDAEATRYSMSGDLAVHRFLPRGWGFSIPLRGSYSWSKSMPRYQSSSDVLLRKELQQEQRLESKSKSLSVSISKSAGSKNPLIRLLLENLSLSGSYSKTTSYSINREDTTTTYASSLDYNLQFGQKRLRLYHGFFIAPLPSNITFGANFSGNEQSQLVKGSLVSSLRPITTKGGTGNFSMNFGPIPNLTTRFSINETRDLNLEGKHDLFGLNLGQLQSHSKKLESNYSLNLFGLISPKINASADYRETRNTTSGLISNNPDQAGGVGSVPGTASRDIAYGTDLSVQPEKIFDLVFGGIGQAAGIFSVLGGGEGDEEEAKSGADDKKKLDADENELIKKEGGAVNPLPKPAQEKTGENVQPGDPEKETPLNIKPDPKQKEEKKKEKKDEQASKRKRQNRDQAGTKKSGIGGRINEFFNDVTGSIGTVTGRYGHRQTLNYNDIDESPNLLFQLGFDDKNAFVDSLGGIMQPQTLSLNDDYQINTRVRLSSRMDFSVVYEEKVNRTKRGGTIGENFAVKRNVNFPNISASLNSIETLPVFKKLFKRASLTSSYKRQLTEDGFVEGESTPMRDKDIDSRSVQKDFSPLLSLNTEFSQTLRFNLSSSFSRSEAISQRQTNETKAVNDKLSFQARAEYTLQSKGGRSFPIIGRLSSDVRITLETTLSNEKGWRGVPPDKYNDLGSFPKVSDAKTLTFRPALSYTFSSAVSGGLQGEYSTKSDAINVQYGNNQTIALSIWTQLKF